MIDQLNNVLPHEKLTKNNWPNIRGCPRLNTNFSNAVTKTEVTRLGFIEQTSYSRQIVKKKFKHDLMFPI